MGAVRLYLCMRTGKPMKWYSAIGAITLGGCAAGLMLGSDCIPEQKEIPLSCSPISSCCPDGIDCKVATSCSDGERNGQCDFRIALGSDCFCNRDFAGPGEIAGAVFDAFWDEVAANPQRLDSSPESLSFFSGGCSQDIYQACRYYGVLQFGAESPDMAAAKTAVEQSCELSNPAGCFLSGGAYYFGVGTEQNPQIAAEYFEQACAMGDERGCEPEQFLAELTAVFQQ